MEANIRGKPVNCSHLLVLIPNKQVLLWLECWGNSLLCRISFASHQALLLYFHNPPLGFEETYDASAAAIFPQGLTEVVEGTELEADAVPVVMLV